METSKFRFQGTLLVPVKNIETSLNFSGLAASKLKIMRSLLSSLKPKTKMNLFRFWKRLENSSRHGTD